MPAYTRDWGDVTGSEPLLAAARRNLIRIAPGLALPGDILVFRMQAGVAKHAGIVTEELHDEPSRFIHAVEDLGVSRGRAHALVASAHRGGLRLSWSQLNGDAGARHCRFGDRRRASARWTVAARHATFWRGHRQHARHDRRSLRGSGAARAADRRLRTDERAARAARDGSEARLFERRDAAAARLWQGAAAWPADLGDALQGEEGEGQNPDGRRQERDRHRGQRQGRQDHQIHLFRQCRLRRVRGADRPHRHHLGRRQEAQEEQVRLRDPLRHRDAGA